MGFRLFHISLFVFVCMLMLTPISNAQDAYDEKHIEVSLRMVGHQILLSTGDSASRVLPIVKSDNRYTIQFESEFAFLPDELVTTVNRTVKETGIAKGYIVEVENCETGEVVYNYEVYEAEAWNTIPCRGRAQPKACYKLIFTLKKAKEFQATLLPVFSGPSAGTSPEPSEINYLAIGLLVLLMGVVAFFMLRKRKPAEVDPNLIPLGEYFYDKRSTELLIENERIKLTSKEADLLLLLYNEVNNTIERDVILNKVWGDEGAYVGRTLDVFISKLRKKLDADSKVKIVNIRGVGYKLVIAA